MNTSAFRGVLNCAIVTSS